MNSNNSNLEFIKQEYPCICVLTFMWKSEKNLKYFSSDIIHIFKKLLTGSLPFLEFTE